MPWPKHSTRHSVRLAGPRGDYVTDVAPPGTIASEYLPDLSALTQDQQATFRVGQIMRLSVVMESTAHDIHALLQNGWPDDVHAGPESFSRLKTEVRDMLRQREFPMLEVASARVVYR